MQQTLWKIVTAVAISIAAGFAPAMTSGFEQGAPGAKSAPPQPQPKGAPTVPAPAQGNAVAQPKVPPLGVLLKKTVGFLSVDYQDGQKAGQIRGTGFFVFYPDKRLGENAGFVYLVTNRH